MAKAAKRKRAESEGSSDGGGATPPIRSQRRAGNAVAGAGDSDTAAPANNAQALLAALQGMDPAAMKELLEAAAQNQIAAAANSTVAAMTGRGSPLAAGGTVVSPTAAPLRVLNPQAPQELMAGNVVTPP